MKAGSFLHEKAAEGISAPSIEETTGHFRTRASPRALRGSNRAKDAGRRRVARNIESRRDPTALLAFWPSHGLFGKSPVATNGG